MLDDISALMCGFMQFPSLYVFKCTFLTFAVRTSSSTLILDFMSSLPDFYLDLGVTLTRLKNRPAECDGKIAAYDGPDAKDVVCAAEDACKTLCLSLPECHSLDVAVDQLHHKRCYLNTVSPDSAFEMILFFEADFPEESLIFSLIPELLSKVSLMLQSQHHSHHQNISGIK